MSGLITRGRYFGHDHIFACDRQCDKAWGDERPRIWVNDPNQTIYGYGHKQAYPDLPESEDDNWVYLADNELGQAPDDNGWYEGGEGKPIAPVQNHNKWCVRQCERCIMIRLDEFENSTSIELPDLTVRQYNMPQKDNN